MHRPLRFLMVLAWALILLVFTQTDNLNNLLLRSQIVFTWNPHPDFNEFFNWVDITHIHHDWIIVKLGHFIGFGLMDLLLFHWIRNKRFSLAYSIFFALLTEVLQLYLNRDGRLYDVIIDSAGAWTAASIVIPILFSGKAKKTDRK